MDIEERAEKYAETHAPTRYNGVPLPPHHYRRLWEIVRDAYLAGSAQTQADYSMYFSRPERR
jgi:hypothetical protein